MTAAAPSPLPATFLACSLLAALVAGCASTRVAAPAAAPGPASAPWQIPAPALGQQFLYRLQYQGVDVEATVRLVLRLSRPLVYELLAADALGRLQWTLRVVEDRGLWIDHRARRYCRLAEAVRLPEIGLPELPLAAVPPLLLGLLPLPPESLAPAGGEFRDREGRRWTFQIAADRAPSQWTLWEDGRPVLWWARRGEERVLSARDRGVQVRWRETVREPLASLAPLAAPPGFVEGRCDGADLP